LSAKTGAGVDALRREMLALAGTHEDMEGVFLARERHLAALRAAEAHLAAAVGSSRRTCAARAPGRGAARGADGAGRDHRRVHRDDLLGVIFSRFCLGK